MKLSFKKMSIVILIALTVSAVLDTNAQNGEITGQSTNLCPGIEFKYALLTAPGCNFPIITVTGGTRIGGEFPGEITVIWNNVPSGQIKADCSPNGSKTLNVSIINTPAPTWLSSGTTIYCGTGSLQLQPSIVLGATSYEWSYPSGVTGPSMSFGVSFAVDVTYTAMGGGPIKVRVASTAGTCNNTSDWSSPFTITRLATPQPTLSKNSSNFELCSGESWVITAASSAPSNYGYDWYVNYGPTPTTAAVKLNGSSTTSTAPLHTQGNTVTLTVPSGYGAFTVNCRLNNLVATCTSLYGKLSGRAGTYQTTEYPVLGPSALCSGSAGSFSSGYIGGDITQYLWGASNSFTNLSGQGTPYFNVVTVPNFQSGQIALQLKNRCGFSGSASLKYVNKSTTCGFSVTASPNPSGTTLNLTTTKNGEAATPNKPLQAMLVNTTEDKVWVGEISEQNTSIDVSSFPIGTYYLKVKDGTEPTTSTRIIIER